MDKDQLIIHSIVNNNIGGSFNELIEIKFKYQLNVQDIIERRIQKLVPHDSINNEYLSVPIRIIALGVCRITSYSFSSFGHFISGDLIF